MYVCMYVNVYVCICVYISGLSMKILRKDVFQRRFLKRRFFKNNAGDLLPDLRFLGGLYNFCNFVIIFSLM